MGISRNSRSARAKSGWRSSVSTRSSRSGATGSSSKGKTLAIAAAVAVSSAAVAAPIIINNNSETSAPTTVTTKDIMNGVKIAEAKDVDYDRDDYQADWDVGEGCDLRARILQETSLVQYKTSDGCTVTYGSWKDVYTGKTFTGNPYRGDGTDNDLDIDHIIPLEYVNSHGGYAWSAKKKQTYGASLEAKEQGVYVAVSASENRKKGNSGPSEYYPPNEAYRCEYAEKWRDISVTYDISLSQADYNVVAEVLESCE